MCARSYTPALLRLSSPTLSPAALAASGASAAGLRVALESRNTAEVYDRAHMRRLGSMLLDMDRAQWLTYYTRAEIGTLTTTAHA